MKLNGCLHILLCYHCIIIYYIKENFVCSFHFVPVEPGEAILHSLCLT